ncbi:MAG: carbohydrate ABC transporter permease [Armatimonadota bacterium]
MPIKPLGPGSELVSRSLVVNTPKRHLWQAISKAWPIYALLLPTVISLVVFSYYPAATALFRSLYDWDIGLPAKWVGLGNFIEMFQSRNFLISLKNILYITIWVVFISTVIPVFVAEMIFAVRNQKAQYWFRIWMILPAIIPSVVTLLIWRFIYDGSIGLLNALLKAVGLTSWTRVWLGDPKTAIWAIIFSGFPYVSGVNVLITLAGLQAINHEIIEASKLDGASTLQRIWYLDLPLLIGQIRLNMVRAVIGAVQMFEIVFVFTGGGPAKSTMVPGLLMYIEGFNYHRMGYASAIGVFLFAIIMLLTILNLKILREKDT